MDYIGLKCPSCNTVIEPDDVVVVCPECGTPHHRECYEDDGHCYFESKHSENFDFQEYIKNKAKEDNNSSTENNNTNNIVICPNCQLANSKSNFYCDRCHAPLNNPQNNTNNSTPNGMPNPQAPFGAPIAFDPMAGMSPDEVIDDGVTAGEVSKYVQQNTPYFLTVFKNIRDYSKSKFSFCGFLFSGGYMLYRKMYKLGIIFTIIVGLLTLGDILIRTLPALGWNEIYMEMYNAIQQADATLSYQALYQQALSLSFERQIIFLLPTILSTVKLVVMIVAGATVNKSYFKHTIKKVKAIKDSSDNAQTINKQIKEKGGINFKLALCLFACYMIITYIPYFFI